MDFSFTDEQQMLRDTLESYLREHWTFEARRLALRGKRTNQSDLWPGLVSDLGLLGVTFPLEAGGLGGGAVEAMLIMEQFGKALTIEPYVPTAILGGEILKRWNCEQAHSLIAEIIAGRIKLAFAHNEQSTRFQLGNVRTRATRQGDAYRLSGRKSVVLGAPLATHFLVTAQTEVRGISLFLVSALSEGASREDFAAIDGQPASNIVFENATASCLLGEEGSGLALLEPAIDAAVVALGAESVGMMRELISQTIAYMRQRKQFGQPLTAFQALQHRLADMAVQLEQAVSIVYMATLALGSEDDNERRAAVSAMKIQTNKSLRFISQQAVQLHGGMGITDELAIGHYFKRAIALIASFGNEDDHYRRYDELVLAEPATRDVRDVTGAAG